MTNTNVTNKAGSDAPGAPQKYGIVVGMDFSELGDRAFLEALHLTRGHAAPEVHVIAVGAAQGSSVRLPGDELRALPEEEAQALLQQHVSSLVRRYQEANGDPALESVAVYVTTGTAAKEILDLAEAVDADLIVVGTHGRRGVERFVLGSVAESVMRQAQCGVFVIRPRDFIRGQKVPDIQPPLEEGQPHLKRFERRRRYHRIDRVARWSSRLMPAT